MVWRIAEGRNGGAVKELEKEAESERLARFRRRIAGIAHEGRVGAGARWKGHVGGEGRAVAHRDVVETGD